jgi:hypothetical protein
MSPKLAALAAWLLVVAFFGVLGGVHIVPQLIYLHDLAKSNRVTYGEIIETYPEMHSTCKYRIAVYFSPGDPGKSVNGDPLALFVNDLIPFALALALFPIFAAIVVYRRARRGALWSGWRF